MRRCYAQKFIRVGDDIGVRKVVWTHNAAMRVNPSSLLHSLEGHAFLSEGLQSRLDGGERRGEVVRLGLKLVPFVPLFERLRVPDVQ